MISGDRMTDKEFERHAFAILQRELGLGGLARFFRLSRAGGADYTRERHRWLGDTTIDDVMAEVESRRQDRLSAARR
jgi:hypothetical protein